LGMLQPLRMESSSQTFVAAHAYPAQTEQSVRFPDDPAHKLMFSLLKSTSCKKDFV